MQSKIVFCRSGAGGDDESLVTLACVIMAMGGKNKGSDRTG